MDIARRMDRILSKVFLVLGLLALALPASASDSGGGYRHNNGYGHHDNHSGKYNHQKKRTRWRGPHRGCHIKGDHHHDDQPPGELSCLDAHADPDSLWPANHKFKTVTIEGLTTPSGQAPDVTVQCITQDEPLNGQGDGNTDYDARLVSGNTVKLRKERAGGGNGRVYHIDFLASDTVTGESCNGSVAVEVPHHKWGKAEDDGRLYTSVEGMDCSTNSNNDPEITSEPITTATETLAYQYAVIAGDIDGDTLGYALDEFPEGMTIDSDGVIDWLPGEGQAGSYNIIVSVDDGVGGSAQQSYTLQVDQRPNTAPVIHSAPVLQGTEEQAYLYQVDASDVDGDVLVYTLDGAPVGMTINAEGLVQWTPATGAAGDYVITVQVTDTQSAVAEQSYTLSIAPKPNTAPAITSLPIENAVEDTLYQYQVIANDPDGDSLTYNLTTAPEGMTIAAGLISWTPDFASAGEHTVTVVASDGQGGIASQSFTITVQDTNRDPEILSIPLVEALEGQLYEYPLEASDEDGDALSYTVLEAPSGLTVDPEGLVSWIPGYEDEGQYVVTLEVSDSKGGSSNQSYTLNVVGTNRDPQITSLPQTEAAEGQLYQYTILATDDDGDSLSYSLQGSPAGMAVDAVGVISWTPGFDQSGSYLIDIVVTDGNGGSVQQTFTVVVSNTNHAPVFGFTPIVIAQENVNYSLTVVATDADNDALSYALLQSPAGMTLNSITGEIQWLPDFNQAGDHSVTVQVSDGAGGFDEETFVITVSDTVINQPPQLTLQSPANGASFTNTQSIAFTAVATDAEDGDLSSAIEWHSDIDNHFASGASVTAQLSVGNHLITAVVTDSGSASSSASVSITVAEGDPEPELPPDPVTVAPPLNLTEITSFKVATDFLYTGASPIQAGVNPDDIEAERVAVVRGKILQRDNTPLSGVTITIKDHPEFGQTLSREDGEFDMAVNGGGILTLNYQKSGYLPVQRQVQAPWRDYSSPDDVVMIPVDGQVTTIDLNNSAAIQLAQGSAQTDADGTRQATVFFPQGSSATMTLDDGSTQPLTTLNVRATEYTVGENGPNTMPGELPPSSGYTYAVELSVDEAISANAKRVDFSQPLPVYVDNFLQFPTGEAVPAGWYDSEKAAWIPSADGRVIEILAITDGKADLDIAGEGDVADADALAALGISDAERTQLALSYGVGKTLWRTPVTHFTPWDFNWPYGPPDDATATTGGDPTTGDTAKPDPSESNSRCGCIIEAQSQALGEEVSIVGTPFKLHYRSDRLAGRKTGATLTIPLSGEGVPGSLESIELTILIAGKTIKQSFPALPDQVTTYVWDGQDLYGRSQQSAIAHISVAYAYKSIYLPALSDFNNSFGQFPSDVRFETEIAREIGGQIKTKKSWQRRLHNGSAVSTHTAGLGGWTLSAHNAYDKNAEIFYRGDGDKRLAEGYGNQVITTAAGQGDWGYSGDNGPATDARISSPFNVVASPDGTVYIPDSENNVIRKVDTEGVITTIAGTDFGYSGDGGPAVNARLAFPVSVAVGPDNSLYIADFDNYRVRKIDANGIITTVAGNGDPTSEGDGGPALNAGFYPYDIAVAPDGTLYIADIHNFRIRKVDPDGIITTLVGAGTLGNIGRPSGVEVGPDGSVYIAAFTMDAIYKVDPYGVFSRVAGTGVAGFGGDGALAIDARLDSPEGIHIDENGVLYIADTRNQRIRRVDQAGVITTIAGNGSWDWNRLGSDEGGPALAGQFDSPSGISLGPDNALYIADTYSYHIRRVSNVLAKSDSGNFNVASTDGSMLYVFDPQGRHIESLDTTTGSIIYSFTYTDEGYLQTITDLDGRITSIERDGSGNPLAIISPDNQRTELSLDANDFLQTVTDPEGNSFSFSYDSEGLMLERIDPRSNSNTFQYDGQGRLLQDDDPVGGGWVIDRTESANDQSYTVTMTSGESRVQSFTVNPLNNGDRQQINVAADGSQSTTLYSEDGSQTTVTADGMEAYVQEGADPRFGMMSPVPATIRMTTPSGLVSNVVIERSATLVDQGDPLSHTQLSETATLNDKASISIYDAATRVRVDTSPEGRQLTTTLDPQGRLIQSMVSGLAANDYSYNLEGRLESIIQDDGTTSRLTTMAYHSGGYQQGFLQSITDAENRQSTFDYDAAGRITKQILPDSREINYSYDESGNLTSLTPPGSSTHFFDYTAVDLESDYSPPVVAGITEPSTQYTYNLDRQLELITRPDGQTVDYVYHATTGQLLETLISRGSYGYSYNAITGQLDAITAPDNGVVSYSYDGSLLLGNTWAGDISGSVNQSYNNDFQVTERCVNGSDCASFAYDDDLLLTQAGDLSISRDPQKDGLITGTGINGVSTARTYNGFGEMESYSADDGTAGIYSTSYTRDKIGRITQQVETIQGATTTYDYVYDLAGRLEEVQLNGVSDAVYTYDSNSNRTHINGVLTAAYDEQDRLTLYGNNIYAYTDNGELLSKTNTSTAQVTDYTYDVLGNLISVILPDATEIEYVVDGQDRRIGKKVDGVLTQGFLYKDQLNPVAELDGSGAVVSRFVYGDKAHVPAYMERGGNTYRIVSDHLGSPRLVIDTADGSVVQRMDYDVWGNVIFDSNPGFQPFGFAGGVYDRDTGLTRFGFRDYDAEVGRWTSKDPIRFDGGVNLFGYVASDPVNFIDPLGLYSGWAGPVGATAGAAGAAIAAGGAYTGNAPALVVGIGLSIAGAGLTAYDQYASWKNGLEAIKEAEERLKDIQDTKDKIEDLLDDLNNKSDESCE